MAHNPQQEPDDFASRFVRISETDPKTLIINGDELHKELLCDCAGCNSAMFHMKNLREAIRRAMKGAK